MLDNLPMVDLVKINKAMADAISADIAASDHTQEKIAEMVGVSKAAVTKWVKKGQISIDNLLQLADCLSKPVSRYLAIYCEFDPRNDGSISYDSSTEEKAVIALVSGLSDSSKIELARAALDELAKSHG